MRILTRRIWRAIRELDSYDDAECRRFVRIARRRAPRRWLHRVLVGATGFFLFAAAFSALFMVMEVAGFEKAIIALPDPVPYLVWSAIIITIVAVSLLPALLVRDRLMRRRLVHVLRNTGTCPECRYSLVGLEIPPDLKLRCPECGHPCQVDESLSALVRSGERVRVTATNIVAELTPEQRRARRRRRLRVAAIVVGAIVVVVGTPLAWWEWHIRAQARQARADAPTAVTITETIRRLRPGLALHPRPHVIELIESFTVRLDEFTAFSTPPRRDGRTDPPDVTMILRGDEELSPDPERRAIELETERVSRELLDALERDGFFTAFRELRDTEISIDDLGVEPTQLFNARLPYLGHARALGRLHRARALVAIERGDTEGARDSVESALALARILASQRFFVDWLVGQAIERLGQGSLERWLASNPTRGELDAIESILDGPSLPNADLALEIERAMILAYLAQVFGEPGRVRLAPIIGAVSPWGAMPVRSIGTWEANRDAIIAYFESVKAEAAVESSARSTAKLPPAPTFEGAALAVTMRPNLGAFVRMHDHSRWRDRSLRTWVAIERWRVDHGEYPESLAVLVPKYLEAIPIDPWSGLPLGYRRIDPATDRYGRAFLLYSYGTDGKDDGGREQTPSQTEIERGAGIPDAVPSGYDAVFNGAAPVPRAVKDPRHP